MLRKRQLSLTGFLCLVLGWTSPAIRAQDSPPPLYQTDTLDLKIYFGQNLSTVDPDFRDNRVRAGSKWVSASGVIPCGIKVTRTHSESDIDLFFPCGMRDFWTVYGLIDHSLFQSGEKHTYYWTSGALASSGTWTAGNVVSFAPSIEGHPNGYFYAPTAGSSNASGEFFGNRLEYPPRFRPTITN